MARGPSNRSSIRNPNERFYYSAPQHADDIICEGSDTDQTTQEVYEKRGRYECQAWRCLEGKLPVLQSTSLRGPLDKGWTNPWRKDENLGWWQPGSEDMMFTRTNVLRWAEMRGLGHLTPPEALARCKAAAAAQARPQKGSVRDQVDNSPSASPHDAGYQSDSSDDPLSQGDSVPKTGHKAVFTRSSVPRTSVASNNGNHHHKSGRKSAKDKIGGTKREADCQWLKGSSASKRARYDGPAPPSPTPLRRFEGEKRRRTPQSRRASLGGSQTDINSEPKPLLNPGKPQIQVESLRPEGSGDDVDELNDGPATFLSALDSLQKYKDKKRQGSTSRSDNGLARGSSLAMSRASTSTDSLREEPTDSGNAETSRLLAESLLAADLVPPKVEVIADKSFVTEIAPSSGNASEFKYRRRRKRRRRKPARYRDNSDEDDDTVEQPAESMYGEPNFKPVEHEHHELENSFDTGAHQNTEETGKLPAVDEHKPARNSPVTGMADEEYSYCLASGREGSPTAPTPSSERLSQPATYLQPGESSPGTIVVDSDSIYHAPGDFEDPENLPLADTNMERDSSPSYHLQPGESSPPNYHPPPQESPLSTYHLQPGESSPGTIVVDTEGTSYLARKREENSPVKDMADMADADTESLASDSEHDADMGRLDDVTPPESQRESLSLPPLPNPEAMTEQQETDKESGPTNQEMHSPTSDQQITLPLLSRQSSHDDEDIRAQDDSHSDSTDGIIQSQIRSEMSLSIRRLSSFNMDMEPLNQPSQKSPSEERTLPDAETTEKTSQTPSHAMPDLLENGITIVEDREAVEEQDPARMTPDGHGHKRESDKESDQNSGQDITKECQLQSPWTADNIQLPLPDLRVNGEQNSTQSSNRDALREEGVIPDSDIQSPERPKTPEGYGIIPFKAFMSPSPSPSRTRGRPPLGGFPNTQALVDAATSNPWARDSQPRRKKRVSFELPDDEQPESSTSGEARRSPPPPAKAHLPSQDDVFNDGTTAVNTFQKHFAAAGSAPSKSSPTRGSSMLASSPAVGAMAEAFIAADRETSTDERGRLASGEGDESPSRHLQPMSQAMANSADSQRERDGTPPPLRGNPLDDVDLDSFLGEAGGFLEEWSVETEMKKTTTPTTEALGSRASLNRQAHGSEGGRLLFGEAR